MTQDPSSDAAQPLSFVQRVIGVVVSPGEFFRELPRLIWHEDEPIAFPSSVPLYFVSRLARDHGVKVVLTGEGADELFLGYDKFAWSAKHARTAAAFQ